MELAQRLQRIPPYPFRAIAELKSRMISEGKEPIDFGIGDPAWDLARPAGFWAAGLMADAEWGSVLDAYAEACTRGVLGAWGPAARDPWIALDLPARCAVYVAATAGIHSEDIAAALQEACLRMAQ